MAKKTYKIELTEVEKFFIDNNYNMDLQELSKILGKPKSLIDEYKVNNPPPKQEEKTENLHLPKAPTGSSVMARQSHYKEDSSYTGAVIFTEAAGMIADKRRETQQTPKTDYIFRPKGK